MTPVNLHGNGNSPFPIGNASSNGGFSIAMLVHQRVYGGFFYYEYVPTTEMEPHMKKHHPISAFHAAKPTYLEPRLSFPLGRSGNSKDTVQVRSSPPKKTSNHVTSEYIHLIHTAIYNALMLQNSCQSVSRTRQFFPDSMLHVRWWNQIMESGIQTFFFGTFTPPRLVWLPKTFCCNHQNGLWSLDWEGFCNASNPHDAIRILWWF